MGEGCAAVLKRARLSTAVRVCAQPRSLSAECARLQSSATSNVAPSAPTAQPDSAAPTPRRLRKGDTIELTISKVAYGGGAVGLVQGGPDVNEDDVGMPVYAPKGAVPGDVVRCMLTKVRRRKPDYPAPTVRQTLSLVQLSAGSRSYAEAHFIMRLSVSPNAVQAPCKHFGNFRLGGGGGCGGCTQQNMAYESQLAEKQAQMVQLFGELCEQDKVAIQDVVPCDRKFNYRNKMEFTFGRRWYESPKQAYDRQNADDDIVDYALGLHAPQRFDKIVSVEECHIQEPVGNDILAFIRERAQSQPLLLTPYDPTTNEGYMRNVALRSSRNTNGDLEVMVNIITSPCDVPERLVPLANELMERFPQVVCVLQNMRGKASKVLVDMTKERLLAGARSYIEQQLCGLSFQISANSFFQTNSYQAEVLYEEVRKAADLNPDDSVLDLFCGTGTIGLSLARHCRKVMGIEVVETAVADARLNASRNGIQNAEFLEGNLDKLKDLSLGDLGWTNADVIVVDPPRAGLHKDLVKFLRSCSARRIVYVSCSPASQLRDIRYLQEICPGQFRVSHVQRVDMFPQTHHIECIVTLERNEAPANS